MSSTTTFSGDCTAKPSSRVLRPPGGGSSISFGSGDSDVPASQPAKKAEAPVAATAAASSHPATEPAGKVGPTNAATPAPTTAAPAIVTAAAGSCGPKKTCGYNPITGEAYSNEGVAAPKQPTTHHVRQPPGGASTRPW